MKPENLPQSQSIDVENAGTLLDLYQLLNKIVKHSWDTLSSEDKVFLNGRIFPLVRQLTYLIEDEVYQKVKSKKTPESEDEFYA